MVILRQGLKRERSFNSVSIALVVSTDQVTQVRKAPRENSVIEVYITLNFPQARLLVRVMYHASNILTGLLPLSLHKSCKMEIKIVRSIQD